MFALADLSSAMSSSTLVETVSLDYDDFSDSFLTCGTCLCQYDAATNTPKLLPCSHTVCRSCLERIVDASRDNTQVRCPICREQIPMPRGGVSAFPPSFIVNQLLDLMARQRRDVIPKCSQHSQQELLFCESCDSVFCQLCTGGAHNGGRGGAAHTVIPFSIAIKRMSEILLYKASLCMSHLSRALDVVAAEMDGVDGSAEKACEAVNKAFNDVVNTVEQRRNYVLQTVRKMKEDKQRVLKEQLDIISAEKSQVESECHGLQQQVEVRNITKKISDLNDKLDVSTTLAEPRENSFMCFEYTHNSALHDLVNTLDAFGRIRISKTFPALCTADISAVTPHCTVHLCTHVTVTTVDYHGNNRSTGGDPISVQLRAMAKDGQQEEEEEEDVDIELTDNDDGMYTLTFTPSRPGKHHLSVMLFGRPIRDSPFCVTVTEHNNPVYRVGKRGSGLLHFIQPCSVCMDQHGHLHVLDTGNSRIQVLHIDEDDEGDIEARFISQIQGAGLEHRSCTGMGLVPGTNRIVVVNWRTKYIVTFDTDTGDVVQKFTCSEFIEPTSVAVNRHGETVVADNGHDQCMVFDAAGKLLHRIGAGAGKSPGGRLSGKSVSPGSFRQITSVYCRPDTDDILVTDKTRLQVFSRDGRFIREVCHAGKAGQYGGVVMDTHGNLLATRQEKGRCVVLVFEADTYRLLFSIDSHDDKLSRPSGLTVTDDGHVIVADLGNDCIKKYRYM